MLWLTKVKQSFRSSTKLKRQNRIDQMWSILYIVPKYKKNKENPGRWRRKEKCANAESDIISLAHIPTSIWYLIFGSQHVHATPYESHPERYMEHILMSQFAMPVNF